MVPDDTSLLKKIVLWFIIIFCSFKSTLIVYYIFALDQDQRITLILGGELCIMLLFSILGCFGVSRESHGLLRVYNAFLMLSVLSQLRIMHKYSEKLTSSDISICIGIVLVEIVGVFLVYKLSEEFKRTNENASDLTENLC